MPIVRRVAAVLALLVAPFAAPAATAPALLSAAVLAGPHDGYGTSVALFRTAYVVDPSTTRRRP
jgi:hypothetical protein